MAVSSTVPKYHPNRVEANEPNSDVRIIDLQEIAERRYILKALKGGTNWLRSKLSGFPVDIQEQSFGDVYRLTITVKWVPQGPMPQLVLNRQQKDAS